MVTVLLVSLAITYLWAGLTTLKATLELVGIGDAMHLTGIDAKILTSLRLQLGIVMLWPIFLPLRMRG
ncbi:hypothetical protein [uncultured Thiodictyon sp.]|uniref:hypothetical protein n=1 Tax=uncultured Thiodictyon sp. TaxID=1846217 RepID=UPI0025D3FF6D|nr:hypothetical protein [uncultured Thiodictyon sp.]